MKVSHIVALIAIAACVAIFLSIMGNTSTYADFSTAFSNPEHTYHIVGEWEKDRGETYDPRVDPNYFAFHLKDAQGLVKKIVYRDNRPPDFEKSEKIVIVGKASTDSTFEAEQILMKCPSKYEEEGIELKSASRNR